MLNIVLVEPEIPMNTGNIARTCAATGSRLHLVRPLGFDISDRAVKRAGLDYWHLVDLRVYDDLDELFQRNDIQDLWLATTKAPQAYSQAKFRDGCWLRARRPAGMVPGTAPGALPAPAHAARSPQPEPGKLRCSFYL